jgi:hypothetical protein
VSENHCKTSDPTPWLGARRAACYQNRSKKSFLSAESRSL